MKRFCAVLFAAAMAAFGSGVMAGDLVNEPHAMIYYQLPFSGEASDTGHHVGFRLDRTVRETGTTVEFSSLMQRPAVMDFRMGDGGVETFTVAGSDLLARWQLYRQAEEDAAAAQAPEGEVAPEAGDETTQPADDELTMGKILDKTPTGVLIGVGIAIVLVTGIGG